MLFRKQTLEEFQIPIEKNAPFEVSLLELKVRGRLKS